MLSTSLNAKLVWMLSVCVCWFLVSFLLHRYVNLVAYLATLFVVSVCKFLRACRADARTGDYKSFGGRIDSATANVLFFKAFSYSFFLIAFNGAIFVVSSIVFTKHSFASVSVCLFYPPLFALFFMVHFSYCRRP